ncbi:hypothetical protein tb265_08710 [Gemmatimonadetes bacterium T265]|nr:hypothetical protein tb265_08710 [Gemmatimonadetes bacterium T265]
MTLNPRPEPSRDWLSVEVLAWQARLRLAVGGAGVLVALASLLVGATAWAVAVAAAVAGVYAGWAALAARRARRRRGASPRLRALVALGDVVFVYALTLALAAPAHYERALVLSTFAVLAAQLYLGTPAARVAFRGTVVGYAALIAWAAHRGIAVDWWGEVVDLALFGLGGGLVAAAQAARERRLARLVGLFERLEEGDFAGDYDWVADRRPDAVSAVGRAYDRMRTQVATIILTDPLSGCVNRRGFEQQLARELARAERAGAPLALLAVDVDHFKRVNDEFGHLAGDAVLREVGAVLRAGARAGDVVARVGGEEFLVVLPDTDAAGAAALAERVVAAAREHVYPGLPAGRRVTVSAGTAAVGRVTDLGIAEELKARADHALYAAKRGGRDRAVAWGGRAGGEGRGGEGAGGTAAWLRMSAAVS